MGLDMYVYKTKCPPKDNMKIGGYTFIPYDPEVEDQADFEGDPTHEDSTNMEILHQWRKHPNLHGLLQEIYYDEGGVDDPTHMIPGFNCETMELNEHDIDVIEECMKDNTLPETNGFFFGKSWEPEEDENGNPDKEAVEMNQERREDDKEFIRKARKALSEGYYLFYFPSW